MDIPGYELIGLLGAGGFGSVYRARQLAVRREVALKIDSRVLGTERDRRRFMREVTAAGRLSGHPNVVAVYDAGVLPDGRPYMVLELCPGGSLNDRLREQGAYPPAEVRDFGVRVADALAAAHASGVLHRDVKPANILIDRYDNVALADFGLASMPTPGMESSATREALTPAYAPPEAFRLDEPGPDGDVYSLAASLYALLSGRPPHFPPNRQLGMAELMEAQKRPVAPIPGVPAALNDVLRQAMAFDRQARTPTAAALRDDLKTIDLLGPATRVEQPPAAMPVPALHSTEPRVPGALPHGTTEPVFGDTRLEPANRRLPHGLILGAAALVGAGILGAGAMIAFADSGSGSAPPASSGSPPQGNGTGGNGTAGNGSSGKPAPNQAAADKKVYGVETTTANCPAAEIPGARARCTSHAECWSGLVVIDGWIFSTSRLDCREKHSREVFAIAPMPPDGQTGDKDLLAKNPTVRKVCSRKILLRSLQGSAIKYRSWKWQVDVLPPAKDEFARGSRVYRCIAQTPGYKDIVGAKFRPR